MTHLYNRGSRQTLFLFMIKKKTIRFSYDIFNVERYLFYANAADIFNCYFIRYSAYDYERYLIRSSEQLRRYR